MSITFLNGDSEFEKKGRAHLKQVDYVFSMYMDWGTDFDAVRYTIKEKFMGADSSVIKDLINEFPKTNHFAIKREFPWLDYSEIAEIKEVLNFFDSYSDFHSYGLSFDFVEAGTFGDQKEGYYCYQLSWGGPSDEIRFYHNKSIEYVFLDWGTGVGFSVNTEKWAKWLLDWFTETNSINWDSIPYEQIYSSDEEE
jgi:hypothetical protein